MAETMNVTPFESSGDLGELFTALNKCQGGLHAAKKDTLNPFHEKKYADLESVWEACREPMVNSGLSIVQLPGATTLLDTQVGTDDKGKEKVFTLTLTKIRTILAHTSGQWISCEMDIMSERVGPQAIGIAVSYARRYMLAAFLGIVQTDDDAEGATDRGSPVPVSSPNNGNTASGYVSDAQWKRLVAKAHSVADSHEKPGDTDFVEKTILKALLIHDIDQAVVKSKQLPKAKYDSICDQVDKWVKKEDSAA